MVITNYQHYGNVMTDSDIGIPKNPIINSSIPDVTHSTRIERTRESDRVGIIRSHLNI